MQRIGRELKEAREAQGISLAFVQQVTRIQRRYLLAIEQGEYQLIPGEVYLKGFIRSYARVVKLDAEALIERYNTLCAHEDATTHAYEVGRLSRLGQGLLQGVQGTLHWFGL